MTSPFRTLFPGRPTVRTVHHFAATGGTVMIRCLAALPGTVVISETTPVWRPPRQPGYARSIPAYPLAAADIVENGLDFTFEERSDIYVRQIRLIESKCSAAGKALVLRDHAHLDFCAPGVARRASLRQALSPHFRLSSIVTVRHPVDSFVSASLRKWLPAVAGFEDYCARMIALLDAHPDAPVFRYEDFTDDPEGTVEAMAAALSLTYDPTFRQRFHERDFAANSGRARELLEIRPLPPRPYPPEAEADWTASPSFRVLATRLGYPASLSEWTEQRTRAARDADGKGAD